MTTWDAAPSSVSAFTLTEGPFWDAARSRLLWVDILGGRAFEGTLAQGRIDETAWQQFAGTCGAVAPAHDGGLLAAAHDRLVLLGPDGEAAGHLVLVDDAGARRFNDGTTDPLGRYVVGTAPLGDRSDDERLWVVDLDGSVRLLDDDLSLSNGLTFSPDGSTLYSVDTFRHTVRSRPYDVGSGTAGEWGAHLVIDDGYPDGLATDADGYLWVAVYGTGEVRRFSPAGELVDVVRTPHAPQATNLAFAGPDLRTLVISTAQEHMTEADIAEHPASGHLFATRVETPGIALAPWRGTWAAA